MLLVVVEKGDGRGFQNQAWWWRTTDNYGKRVYVMRDDLQFFYRIYYERNSVLSSCCDARKKKMGYKWVE